METGDESVKVGWLWNEWKGTVDEHSGCNNGVGRMRKGRPRMRWEGGLCEEKFGGIWRGAQNEISDGTRSKAKVEDQYRCPPHPELQAQSGELQQLL